ncbi:hypothetical protein [Thalassococcus lentus]|uniref:Uncharacterized protein n=1 Tax=Thalassococcus lentus TaxID=1210524 RepID=A0ABT4XPN2_9RHOB|nr:hypothetical protein [Thalassococcus lentus]MDA7423909.1 hypothetical protein [Thalassococcus lentus]
MKTRFIKSITENAKQSTPAMPWARGARRAEFIAKRDSAPQPVRRTA